MNAINWPERFTPGTTDNYVSNEIIITGVSVEDVWVTLNDTSLWSGYYNNVSDIVFHEGTGPILSAGARFRFTTFRFLVEASIGEYVAPLPGNPARIGWYGSIADDADNALDVYHAWLFEALPGGRVRILTQESQIGKPAQQMARQKPNPMLNAHQDWIEGLAETARKRARKN